VLYREGFELYRED